MRSALAVLALVLAGCGYTANTHPTVPPPASVPASATSHVVVVVMENHEATDVLAGSPYVSGLARRYTTAPRSFAIRHPSLPNYLALTGGSTFKIDSDCTDCHVAARNIVDQLETAHKSWKAYMEGMPRPCYRGAQADGYAKKHDPFLYYDDVASRPRRCAKVVPATELAADLAHNRLPAFAWLTPDLCHDTHDCSLATGDRYLAGVVPSLLRGLGPHGILILTWDEGSSDAGCCGVAHGGRILTVLAGPDVRRGARLAGEFTHYSTLRTVENAFGLPPLAGASAAAPLRAR